MPSALNGVLNPGYDTSHTLTKREGRPWSMSKIWRHAQGIARTNSMPNYRDHSSCDCDARRKRRNAMPQIAEIKVGTRNREKTANIVEWLFEVDELFDVNGEFYKPMLSKGIQLTEGEDYQILDPDGNVTHMKSAPERVRKLLIVEVAERLNCPTSVKVPETGQNVASGSRNWVSFRPRIDTPFQDDEARDEYVAKAQ